MERPDVHPPSPDWVVGPDHSPFAGLIGPIYHYRGALPPGEAIRLAFRVREQLCNPRGTCHGGMLAAFLDLAMARGAHHIIEGIVGAPTASLTVSYIRPATLDAWVETRLSLTGIAGRTAFLNCGLLTSEEIIAQGQALLHLRHDRG